MLMFDPAETTILELGSGCGLLGIVMAELCQDLLLTDQKPVLPLLLKNLRKNLDKRHFDRNSASASYGAAGATNASDGTPLNPTTASSPAARRRNDRRDGGGSVKSVNPCYIQVQELVWGEELDQDLRNGIGVDYVVATDVIYNESVVPKLIYTLRELCESRNRARQEYSQGHGSRLDRIQRILSTKYGGGEEGTLERARSRTMKRMLNKTVVLLAQELRTDYVHLTFLEGLQEAGFQIVRMPKGAMDPAYHSGYVIYACFLRG
ncbi:hypothetical protein B0O80DRAFT_4029 [Mortierella sp. GBAus27b]|nr:hypothetical protein B0O80DRAFT_4029 [Mortierella sp. GBAus27b]